METGKVWEKDDLGLMDDSIWGAVAHGLELAGKARQKVGWWRALAEERVDRTKDKVANLVVDHLLPHRVVKWAFVTVAAHASFKLSDREMPSITVVEALRSWERRR